MTKATKTFVTFIAAILIGLMVTVIVCLLQASNLPVHKNRVDDEMQKLKQQNDSLKEVIKIAKVTESMCIVKDLAQPFSDSAFIVAIKNLKIKHPHIAYAQAVLESGNFTSDLCVNHKNLFGMRPAKTRLHFYSYTTGSNYAGYDSWYLSLLDYATWQLAYARNLTEKEYYAFVQRNYSETGDYVARVKVVVERNKHKFSKVS